MPLPPLDPFLTPLFDPAHQRLSTAQTDFRGLEELADPSYPLPPFLSPEWSGNSACAANSVALLNDCCYRENLKKNPKVPGSARLNAQYGDGRGITLWLTNELYKCIDKSIGSSAWRRRNGSGLNLVDEYKHLLPCKIELMESLGIEENLCMQHMISPRLQDFGIGTPPVDSNGNPGVDLTLVPATDDEAINPENGTAAFPNENCPCVVGGQLRIGYSSPKGGHAVTLTATKCNDDGSAEYKAREHPYQSPPQRVPTGRIWDCKITSDGMLQRPDPIVGRMIWRDQGLVIHTMCCCNKPKLG